MSNINIRRLVNGWHIEILYCLKYICMETNCLMPALNMKWLYKLCLLTLPKYITDNIQLINNFKWMPVSKLAMIIVVFYIA